MTGEDLMRAAEYVSMETSGCPYRETFGFLLGIDKDEIDRVLDTAMEVVLEMMRAQVKAGSQLEPTDALVFALRGGIELGVAAERMRSRKTVA